jgi:hypothetical protein
MYVSTYLKHSRRHSQYALAACVIVGSVTIGRAVFNIVTRHIAAFTDVAGGWDCTMRYTYFTPVTSPCSVCAVHVQSASYSSA